MNQQTIVIFGAGAMGCLLGGKLMQAGLPVQFIARGERLRELREHGLTLVSGDAKWHSPVQVSDDPASIGVADIVFITAKTHQLEGVAQQIAPLLGPDTVVVPALNGIPWWYFHGLEGAFTDRHLRSLDSNGVIAAQIPSQQVLGCVNYCAAIMGGQGVVEYVDYFARSMILGELGGQLSPRLNAVHALLESAGLDPVVSEDIRRDIWHKLWGNIAFNPISALTHATMDAIAQDYDDTDLVMAVMNEARAIGEKLGVDFLESPRTRIANVAKRKGHKTSMLQDIEAGRKSEIEAIVGAVREIGNWLEESMPHLNSLYSLVKLKERFFIPSESGSWQKQDQPELALQATPVRASHNQ